MRCRSLPERLRVPLTTWDRYSVAKPGFFEVPTPGGAFYFVRLPHSQWEADLPILGFYPQ